MINSTFCKKITLLLVLIFSVAALGFSTNEKDVHYDIYESAAAEECVIHLDKHFYVTGEIVWYKLYLTKAFKNKPVVIKASIQEVSGEVVNSTFVKSEGKTFVEGYYKIPFNFSSGVRVLHFTTLDKVSQEVVHLAKASIPIYNDLEGIGQLVANESNNNPTNAAGGGTVEEELMVSIQLPKRSFSPREKVTPFISVKDKSGQPVKGNVSVSVIDWKLAGNPQINATIVKADKTVAAQQIGNFSNDLYLRGTVLNEKEEPIALNVLGAYSRDEDKVFYTKSKTDGSFFITVPDYYGEQPFQLLNMPKEIDKIKIKQAKTNLPLTGVNTDLVFNDQIANYLELSRQRKKIFQYYTTLESNLQVKEYPNNTKPIKSDKTYITKEYEDFEFMYIFFKENLSQLRFQFQKDSTYLARMLNPRSREIDNFFKDSPLFIIDGIATRDGDFIARMRMDDIEKVDIYHNISKLNSRFKIFASSGLIRVNTYDAIENLPVFEANNILQLNGLIKEASFPTFDPTVGMDKRQAFFRPQLYWNPTIETKSDGSASFDYYQSDDISTFRIKVVAQSEDGRIGVGEVMYTVQ